MRLVAHDTWTHSTHWDVRGSDLETSDTTDLDQVCNIANQLALAVTVYTCGGPGAHSHLTIKKFALPLRKYDLSLMASLTPLCTGWITNVLGFVSWTVEPHVLYGFIILFTGPSLPKQCLIGWLNRVKAFHLPGWPFCPFQSLQRYK